MKTKNLILFVLFGLMVLPGISQNSNGRFGIEISVGPSFAIQKLGGADLNTGVGIKGILHFRVLPHTGIYAGWGWNKFSADNSFAGTNTDFEETGYVYGLQFKHPIGISRTAWYLRAGGLYNHIEMENERLVTQPDKA